QRSGLGGITLFAYLGGFASATGMVMIEAMAVATMVSNNILLPAIRKRTQGQHFSAAILLTRWASAGLLILAAWAYGNALGGRYGLVSIGMVSFAAVFQFMPATLGGLFWKGGTRAGAWTGLLLGFGTWLYSLFIPAIVKSYWPNNTFLTEGPWGWSWLRPSTLFGMEGIDPFVLACAASIAFNAMGYVLVSLATEPCRKETADAEEFMRVSLDENAVNMDLMDAEGVLILACGKRSLVEALLSRFMSAAEAKTRTGRIFRDLGIYGEKMTLFHLAEIHARVERDLAATMGAANAYTAVEQAHIFTDGERTLLSSRYADLIARMKISPRDLLRKVNFYQEREQILQQQTALLEKQVAEKSAMLLETSKFAALGQMAGGIAHEINSPLLIISLSGEQLAALARKEAAIPKDTVLTVASRIEQTVRRIARIVQGLRSFARQGSGAEDRKNVSVTKIVEDTLSLCQERFKNHGVKLEIRHQDKNLSLHCNDVQLEQVLLNLLNNAFDATEGLPERWVRLESAGSTGGGALIRITDSGSGIPKHVADRLFTPFFTTKEVGKGTGLGLSISKGIIESHGGSLSVDHSCPNTCFLVTLPPATAQAALRTA
ncbi:MAG: GHKL domain-containing protein, partial [Bdellovibrionales bacterium]|nr:GHKL domain-containing protein [Bdellovibrionales bacterium]